MEKQKLKFHCSEPNLDQLVKAHPTDAGYDLCCAEHTVTVPAREWAVIATGVRLAIPEGYVGIVKPRSGLAAKQGIDVGAGVIDSGYRGEVKVVLFNHSDTDVQFQYGDRIAQLVVLQLFTGDLEKVESTDDLPEADRAEKGFGSSGV